MTPPGSRQEIDEEKKKLTDAGKMDEAEKLEATGRPSVASLWLRHPLTSCTEERILVVGFHS